MVDANEPDASAEPDLSCCYDGARIFVCSLANQSWSNHVYSTSDRMPQSG